MSSLSTRLGLVVNAASDPFDLDDFLANYAILDAKPGVHVCTAATRPTWGSNQNGMLIYETDTDLIWSWSGTAWERHIAKGFLAQGIRTADVSTSSTILQVAITQAVTVLAGNRRHQITVMAPNVYNSLGLTRLAIFRDGTSLREWFSQGTGSVGPAADAYPRLNAVTIIDQPTAGAHTYTLQYSVVSAIGGTSTIAATPTNPATLDIVEI